MSDVRAGEAVDFQVRMSMSIDFNLGKIETTNYLAIPARPTILFSTLSVENLGVSTELISSRLCNIDTFSILHTRLAHDL